MPRIRRLRFTKRRTRVKRSYGARKRRIVVRRSAYRRKRGRRNMVSVQSSIMRLPDRKRVKLVYKDIRSWLPIISGVPGAVPFATQFRCNSVAQPQFAAGGHQPMYFDQWSTWYKRYCVTGAKINFKVRCISKPDQTTNSGSIDVITLACLNGSSTPGFGTWAGGLSEQLENAVTNPDLKMARFNANRGIVDDHRMTLTHKWSARRFLGKRDIIDDPNNCGLTVDLTAANPNATWTNPVTDVCFNPYFTASNPAGDATLGYEVETTIIYNVWFFERRRRVIQS